MTETLSVIVCPAASVPEVGLTLSHGPPVVVAAAADQFIGLPPVFFSDTDCGVGVGCPANALKVNGDDGRLICAGVVVPGTQFEIVEVFTPAAFAVAVMFWPVGNCVGGIFPLPSVVNVKLPPLM